MSDEIVHWRWRYTDDFGRRRIFPCPLSQESAKALRDLEKIQGSRVVHRSLGLTSDFLNRAVP